MEYDLENNFKKYPLIYRLLHDKKNNTKFFNDLNYQDFFIILKEADKKNEKVILNDDSFNDKIFTNTKNKGLTFEENLYMQKTDYYSLVKMHTKISLFFSVLTYGLIKFTKQSLDIKKPFAFLDNNRLLHNRLCSLRNSLHYSLKFFFVCFSGFFFLNLLSMYVLKYVYTDDRALDKKLKEKYINKVIFYEEMLK